MPLSAPNQAIVDTLVSFNSEPHNVSTNPNSLAHPATPTTFPLALTTTADAMEAIAGILDGLGVGSFTISTSTPSGGNDGDVWFQVPV